MRKKRKTLKLLEPYFYLIPTFLIIIVFIYYPFAKTAAGSFFKVDIYGRFNGFTGLSNYMKLFTSGTFYQALIQTFIHTALFVPLSIVIGLFLALCADKKSRFHRGYEVMFCLTMAVSMSIACLIFKLMYNQSFGLFNQLLGTQIAWLTEKRYALSALTLITIWSSIGFNYIYLSAAVKNVPEDILESAELDGANFIKKIWYFTIPMISPSLFYLLITSTITGLTMITPVLILTQGGPSKTTNTLIYSMYAYAYTDSNYSIAYAYGMVVFVIVAVVTGINFLFERKGVFYG